MSALTQSGYRPSISPDRSPTGSAVSPSCVALTSIKDANYDAVVGLTAVHCIQLRDGCFWEKIK